MERKTIGIVWTCGRGHEHTSAYEAQLCIDAQEAYKELYNARAWARRMKVERDVALAARDHWKGWYESLVAYHESTIVERDDALAKAQDLELQLCDVTREREDWKHSAEFREAIIDAGVAQVKKVNMHLNRLIEWYHDAVAQRDEARAWARKLKRERDELEAASKQALLALEAWPTSPVPHIVQRAFKRIQEALA